MYLHTGVPWKVLQGTMSCWLLWPKLQEQVRKMTQEGANASFQKHSKHAVLPISKVPLSDTYYDAVVVVLIGNKI